MIWLDAGRICIVFWPDDAAKWKARRSPKFLQFILRWTWMAAPIVMPNLLVIVEISTKTRCTFFTLTQLHRHEIRAAVTLRLWTIFDLCFTSLLHLISHERVTRGTHDTPAPSSTKCSCIIIYMTGMCGKQAATKRVDYLPRVKEKRIINSDFTS